MPLEDKSILRLSGEHHALVMTSRPGYLMSRGAAREACGPFVQAMRQERIGLAVVLMTDDELEAFYGFDLCRRYTDGGVEALGFPIVDGSIPEDIASFHGLVRALRDRLARHAVLVHCNAGLGRTGVVAACLLVREGSRADTAITLVRRARPGALENRGQEEFIRAYDRSLRPGHHRPGHRGTGAAG